MQNDGLLVLFFGGFGLLFYMLLGSRWKCKDNNRCEVMSYKIYLPRGKY